LITAAEAAQNHAEWYEKYKDLYHPKTVELIERGQKVAPEYLETALTGREKLRQELIDIMEEAGIDMWLSPSAPGAAPKGLDSTGNPVMNLPWTHSGLPTLSLPSGLNRQGLPLGLQVAAGWYQDELLFSYGTLIQAAML
jgi:Asp-tRNA(Asn)/Glu-tRNA(Gln) amidotransferase A subunit family amidase